MNKFGKILSNKNALTSILFIVTAAVGICSSSYFYQHLASLHYQFGKEAIGLFIPPFLTVVFMYVAGKKHQFSTKFLWLSLLLFIIQLLPFGSLLFEVVQPNPKEDFERYIQYAQHMIDNGTVWGSDQIRYPHLSKAYITQPGYRYFVALELLIFQNLFRFVSILNTGIFLTAIFYLFKLIHKTAVPEKLQQLISLLVLLTIPYAVKNILMGLTEWFVILFLIWCLWLFIVRKNVLAAIAVLAFIPFIRQNLLPPVLILLFLFCFNNRLKWKAYVLFLLILLLPVYHNLYYAGEFRFFTSIFKWPFVKYDNAAASGFDFFKLINNLLHYAGLDISKKPDFLEESFLFLLLFVGLYFYMPKFLQKSKVRFLYFTITLITVLLPTLLLGTDFYPRFEFVNVYFVLAFFLVLDHLQTQQQTDELLHQLYLKRRK
jgi:hypothetical protein